MTVLYPGSTMMEVWMQRGKYTAMLVTSPDNKKVIIPLGVFLELGAEAQRIAQRLQTEQQGSTVN